MYKSKANFMHKKKMALLVTILIVLLHGIWFLEYYRLNTVIYCDNFEKAFVDYNVEFFTNSTMYANVGNTESECIIDYLPIEKVKTLQEQKTTETNSIVEIIYLDSISTDLSNMGFIQYVINGFSKDFEKKWNDKIELFPASGKHKKTINRGYYYSSIIKIMYPLNIEVQAKVKIPVDKILSSMKTFFVIAAIVVIIFLGMYFALFRLYSQQRKLSMQKDVFINQMSHDFRLPLSGIKGGLNNIELKYPKDEQTQRIIALCHSSIDRLDGMIDNVLTASAMGKGILHNGFIYENEIIEIINDIKQEILINKKVDIIIDDSKLNNNEVFANHVYVRQILENLLNNSVTYCERSPQVHINFTPQKKGLEISISDNGVGVPEEDRAHIFENFYRGTNFTTINGTGLGLYIAKEFTKLMKGDLKLISSSPEGSTFVLFLKYLTN